MIGQSHTCDEPRCSQIDLTPGVCILASSVFYKRLERFDINLSVKPASC